MFTKKGLVSAAWLTAILVVIYLLAAPAAQARAPQQEPIPNNCLSCHEELYQLRDTGKAYCLHNAPMACVDCHGGNPAGETKEAAHFNRAAHPVLNENAEKCYECHPAQAQTRLETFRQVAGLATVRVSPPCLEQAAAPAATQPAEDSNGEWVLGLETLTLFIVLALALTAFLVHKVRHG